MFAPLRRHPCSGRPTVVILRCEKGTPCKGWGKGGLARSLPRSAVAQETGSCDRRRSPGASPGRWGHARVLALGGEPAFSGIVLRYPGIYAGKLRAAGGPVFSALY